MKKINFLHQKLHLNFSNTCSILAGRRGLENCLAAEQVKKYIVDTENSRMSHMDPVHPSKHLHEKGLAFCEQNPWLHGHTTENII